MTTWEQEVESQRKKETKNSVPKRSQSDSIYGKLKKLFSKKVVDETHLGHNKFLLERLSIHIQCTEEYCKHKKM